VALLAGHLVELATLVKGLLGPIDVVDHLLEGGLIAEDLLGAIVVVPEARIAGRFLVLLELLELGFVVKDASAARRSGLRGARRDP
ncbi:MAG TPA: hypothetical protein VK034_13045, partial [Enhygromyxa sp.]|nr:hypothetical protein [Enhygromyxa sp.]